MSRIIRKLIALMAVIVTLAIVTELLVTAWNRHPTSSVQNNGLALQKESQIAHRAPGSLADHDNGQILLNLLSKDKDRDLWYDQLEKVLDDDSLVQYPDSLRDDGDDFAMATSDEPDDSYGPDEGGDVRISIEGENQGYLFDRNHVAAQSVGSKAVSEGVYRGFDQPRNPGSLERETQTVAVQSPAKEEAFLPFSSQKQVSVQELEDARRAKSDFYEPAVTTTAMARSGTSPKLTHSSDVKTSKDRLVVGMKQKETVGRVQELRDRLQHIEKKVRPRVSGEKKKLVVPHTLEDPNPAFKPAGDQSDVPPLQQTTDAGLRSKLSSLHNSSRASQPVHSFTRQEVAIAAERVRSVTPLPATIPITAAASLARSGEHAPHSLSQGMGNTRMRRRDPRKPRPPAPVKLSKESMTLLGQPIPTSLPLVEGRGFPLWRNSSVVASNLPYLNAAVRITHSKKRHLTNHSLNPDIVARGEFQQAQMDKFCQRQSLLSQLPSNPSDLHTLLQHLLYDDSKKIVYCYIPKNGCSNMKRLLLILNGILPPESVQHRPAEEILKKVHSFRTLTPEEALHKLKNYYKLIIVRNPLERLLSAYRNKLEQPLKIERRHTFPDKVKMFILHRFRPGALRE